MRGIVADIDIMFPMKLFVGVKGVVVFNRKVLLLRESSRYEDGTKAGKWDVPGGRIKPEEDLHTGLKREVEEECGLKVTPGELLRAFDGFPEIRGEKCHVVRLYFLCTAESAQVTLSDDHDQYEWVDPADIGDRMLVDDVEEMLHKVVPII